MMQTPQSTSQSTINGGGDPVTPLCRGHLLAIFELDRLDVYPSAARTAHEAIDNIACFVCQEE
eukprot:7224813-Pyramimonas_sp.AAC.1